MGVVDIDVGSVVKGLFSGLDGLFTSDEERLKYQDKIEQRLHDRLSGQVQTNIQEAKHPSIFVSGWRPALGWVCVGGIGYEFILRPLFSWITGVLGAIITMPLIPAPPPLDVGELMSLVVAMLGIAGYRTYEKVKKVERKN